MKEVTQVRAFCDFIHVGLEERNAQTVKVVQGGMEPSGQKWGGGQWADSSMTQGFLR